MNQSQQQVAAVIQETVAKFISEQSNRTSLITVTRTTVSPDQKYCDVYISVMPTDDEEKALRFLERNRTDMKQYLKEHTRTRRIPFVRIHIDSQEKMRQNVTEKLEEME